MEEVLSFLPLASLTLGPNNDSKETRMRIEEEDGENGEEKRLEHGQRMEQGIVKETRTMESPFCEKRAEWGKNRIHGYDVKREYPDLVV